LQVSVNKRFSHGLSAQTSYTLSRNIDYASRNDNATDNTISNPFNFFGSRGLADNHHKHRFVNSFVWALPDPGKASGSHVLSAIAGNWELSGILTLMSGSPFTVFSSEDVVAGAGVARADATGPVALSGSRSRGEKVAEYFNTSALVQAAPGTYGNLGRNSIIGPSFSNLDATVFRRIPLRVLGESGRLALRAEAFNVFNTPHFANPNPDLGAALGSSSFGQLTETSSDARILQFSLKVEF
jgi:hypothetical protein